MARRTELINEYGGEFIEGPAHLNLPMFLPTFDIRIVPISVSSSWTGKFDFPL
jgi:hypothetical protein